jgi:hypothetical protein
MLPFEDALARLAGSGKMRKFKIHCCKLRL